MDGHIAAKAMRHAACHALRSYARYARPQYRAIHTGTSSTPTFRRCVILAKWTIQRRNESTSATGERPLTDRKHGEEEQQKTVADAIAARKAQEPAYDMTFTCRRCLTRSSHRVTKQAYHFGTTLITCPGCQKRHLISDHLRIFSDKSVTIEDILKEKGELLRKGRLGENGDIEFYDDEAVEKVQAREREDNDPSKRY